MPVPTPHGAWRFRPRLSRLRSRGVLLFLALLSLLPVVAQLAPAPEETPAMEPLPRIWPGDRGAYVHEVWHAGPDGPIRAGSPEPWMRFEWSTQETLLDANGERRFLDVVRITRDVEDPLEAWTVWFDAETVQVRALHWAPAEGAASAPRRGENPQVPIRNQLQQFVPGRSDPAMDLPAAPVPCGFRIALDRGASHGSHDAALPLCGDALPGSPWWTATAQGRRVRDARAPESQLVIRAGEGDAGATFAWFEPTIPFPIRVARSNATDAGRFEVYRLAQFERGSPPPDAASHEANLDLRPLAGGPRWLWGPDEAGVVHPFPLSQAFEAARDDPAQPALRDYLARHADAYTQAAEYRVDSGPRGTLRWWRITVTDGASQVTVCPVQQDVESARFADLSLALPPGSSPPRACERSAPGSWPKPNQLPSTMPSVASLLSRTPRQDEAQTVGATWGFAWTCSDPQCTRADLDLHGGFVDQAWPRPGPGATDARLRRTLLHVNETGQPQYVTTEHVEAVHRFGDAPPVEAAAAIAPRADSSWALPLEKALALAGLAALAALAAHAIISAMKSGWTGSYTRLAPTKLGEQPVRAQILRAVEEQPGLHFGALLRACPVGRGNLRRHLQLLHKSGLIVERRGPRYVCYFRAATMDRRAMDAAPLLLGGGARALIHLVGREPGITGRDAAQRLGLRPSTVHFHVVRLERAGLVRRERQGRHVRHFATDRGTFVAVLDPGSARFDEAPPKPY